VKIQMIDDKDKATNLVAFLIGNSDLVGDQLMAFYH
jgi:hypothetical protein